MHELIIISDPNHERLAERTAQKYRDVVTELSNENLHVVSGWPGGRSLLKFFPAFSEVLSSLPTEVLDKQQFFQVDERVFQDFNQDVLEANFFASLVNSKLIDRSQVHYLSKGFEPEKALEDYINRFQRFNSKFNYIMLGAGNAHQRDNSGQVLKYDCHIAGVFPHHISSEIDDENFIYYFDSPKPPNGRVTASKGLLLKTEYCFLFIMGEEKKEVLKEFLDPNVSIKDAPIKLASKIKNCILITDQKV